MPITKTATIHKVAPLTVTAVAQTGKSRPGSSLEVDIECVVLLGSVGVKVSSWDFESVSDANRETVEVRSGRGVTSVLK